MGSWTPLMHCSSSFWPWRTSAWLFPCAFDAAAICRRGTSCAVWSSTSGAKSLPRRMQSRQGAGWRKPAKFTRSQVRRRIRAPRRRSGRYALLQPWPHLFVRDQPIENRQHLLAIRVHAVQILAEGCLEIARPHPLLQHRAGHVDVLPERVHIVSPQEEAVEEGGFPLGCQGIEFFAHRHNVQAKMTVYPWPQPSGKSVALRSRERTKPCRP